MDEEWSGNEIGVFASRIGGDLVKNVVRKGVRIRKGLSQLYRVP